MKIQGQKVTFPQWLWMKKNHNLLTPNQGLCTSILNSTVGFGQASSGSATISSSTNNLLSGQRKSLGVICTTGVDREGIITTPTTVVNGLNHTAIANVVAPVGATLQIWWYTDGIVSTANFTGTGTQQIIKCSGVATSTNGVIYVMLHNANTPGTTFNIRNLILRKGSS